MPAAPRTVRCASCSSEIPPGAKFCPRCGKPALPAVGQPAATPTDLGKLPAPIPVAGIVFILALVVGPAAVVAGIILGSKLLLYAGITVAVGVIVLLLLGLVF